jgi:hypothetical protein
MTVESRITFWSIILWHTLRAAGRQAKAVYAERIRRQLDRYSRIGRHHPHVVGLANVRWATVLTDQLRVEHELRHWAHAEVS